MIGITTTVWSTVIVSLVSILDPEFPLNKFFYCPENYLGLGLRNVGAGALLEKLVIFVCNYFILLCPWH